MDFVLNLDPQGPIPLYQQLVAELRQAILQGRLKPNQKLPSSRSLAKSLAISRSTVTLSYEQLLSEGYLETRYGSGTFVCPQLPGKFLKTDSLEQHIAEPSELTMLSRFALNLMSVNQEDVLQPQDEISFRFDRPATERFPVELWRRLLARSCHRSTTVLDYMSDAAGYLPLRIAIADYLGRSRAVRCSPEQIIIVNGSQQALALITQLTINPGDWAVIEEPGYLDARCCFQAHGANLYPIPVDSDGLDVDELQRPSHSFKLLYLTPSHQFPTGVTLSLSRRLALLRWAEETGTLILEDDYDSEFRYGDRPIPALQGLDQNNCVIYVGTFSKVLFPSLRIGYLVVPPAWIPIVSRAKWLCDRQAPSLEQYALTECITDGHFERHIRRMRNLYDRRRRALVDALNVYLGSKVTILGDNAGIHLMARIKTDLPDEIVIQKAARLGVGLVSAQGYYLKTPKTGEFILGYTQLDEIEIEQGIQQLAQVFKDDKQAHP